MTKPIPLPSQEYLHKCLLYNPDTGVLTYKERDREDFPKKTNPKTWNTKYADKQITCRIKTGYVRVVLHGKQYKAHRIIWKMIHNEEPEQIDHVNGVRHDNRLENLRPCTNATNAMNKKPRDLRGDGIKGISWITKRGMWRAEIKCDGKRRCLGYFSNRDDAAMAYSDAAKELFRDFAWQAPTSAL
jgi:hypothetical protein